MTNEEIESEKLKFLMNVFDKMQDLKMSNPSDPNLPEIERLFIKHAKDKFAFQKLRLTDIQEYSIESVITKQANEFYSSIPYFVNFPQIIKEQLLADYTQMEHQRRRDNFERFCQCIYQQIEAIVTQLWSIENKNNQSKLWNHILQNRTNKAFANRSFDNVAKQFVLTPYSTGFKIQNIIFKYNDYNRSPSYFSDADYDTYFNNPNANSKDKKNDFQVKLRTVLFVLYFEENVLQEKFEELFDTLYEITLIRNTFHRGPNGFTSYQQNIINRIYQNPSSHYHKFFGALCDFLVKSLNSNKINIL
jgi:hypothetical protein